jgi:hypothetical protein
MIHIADDRLILHGLAEKNSKLIEIRHGSIYDRL